MMNRLENWFCATSFWRNMTQREVLPWLLRDVELGEHILELGAGPGAGTEELRKRVARVTSLEYGHDFSAGLARRSGGSENGAVVQGDASTLPFPEKTFSAAIAVLMLHHLRSPEAQESALRETFRVLRPGGKFIALDIPDGWLHRVIHIRSTFVPFAPETAPARLAAAGFSGMQLAFRRGAYRWHAERPR